VTLFHPSGRPTGRGRWPARWVAALGALLLLATLVGLSHAAGAQQSPASTTAAAGDPSSSAPDTSVDDTATSAPDNSAPDTTVDDATTTEAAAADPNGNVNNLPLHDGTQKGNVFNATPYGEIPANTPEVLVLRPGSGRILPLNTEIQIRARFHNFQPGLFNDPKTQYGIQPQRLNSQGNLQGHNHGCIQRIAADGAVPDVKCDSFVVLEQVGDTDVLTGVAPPLTVAGRYRVCVDAASGAHYVAARAFAQQGGPVDCVRVLVLNLRRR
jgi:hypothetical protein